MKIFAFALLLFTSVPSAHATDLTAYTAIEAGKAFPQSNLADFLIDGTAYRIDFFGGAKLQNIKFLSAIGLGLDFTYTTWRAKNDEAGFRYKEYQWDMFKLPIQVGWFMFEPGIIWMVTDVGIPHLNIDHTSIRPGINFTAGLRVPLLPHFNLRADGRIQRVMMEKELTKTNERFNVTGQSYSLFAGGELYF
jgi:hypothetical protein